MFDIKTVRVDKSESIYTPGVHGSGRTIGRAVKKRATSCRASYLNRAKKLDEKHAAGDTSKPFTSAIKNTFATGNAIPLVSGAIGELNVEGHRLIELLARYVAAIEDNSDITPEDVSSARGNPYNLLLAQFRRAIGCVAIRTAVEEKLRRVHLIRSSKAEANSAAQSGMGNHRCTPNRQSPSWFNSFRNEDTFNAFYRYRTQYDHFYTENRNCAGF